MMRLFPRRSHLVIGLTALSCSAVACSADDVAEEPGSPTTSSPGSTTSTSAGGSGGSSTSAGGGGSGGTTTGAGGTGGSSTSAGGGGAGGSTSVGGGGAGGGGGSTSMGGGGSGGSTSVGGGGSGGDGGAGGGGAGGASTTTSGPACDEQTCAATAASCQVASCKQDTCVASAAQAGSPCVEGVCDGAGVCVECVTDADCGDTRCDAATNTCNHATCDDGLLNGAETDTDCGSNCDACPDGKKCWTNTDCWHGSVCEGGICTVDPLCANNQHDVGEDGVDCGGTCALACPSVDFTTPLDGAKAVAVTTSVAVTFKTPMSPATLTGQVASGACSGSLQLSADGFVSCLGFKSATPAMSAGDTVATLEPLASLGFLSNHAIRVLAGALDPKGNPVTEYVSSFKTSGCADGLANQVVISQVYGGGGNANATYTHDFIELHNRGEATVDISGWSVQYAKDNGLFSNGKVTPIPADTSIPAGGYFLIQQAGGDVGSPLPTPDLPGGTIAMAAGSGKVALVKSSTKLSDECPTGGDLVDLVGYGSTASACAGKTTNLIPTTSAFRNGAGCIDTDVGADFTVAAVSPRNNGTPVNICATCN